jgi:hypothetical protein
LVLTKFTVPNELVNNKKSPSDIFTFVLNRDGILRWQLVDIDIPSLDKRQ